MHEPARVAGSRAGFVCAVASPIATARGVIQPMRGSLGFDVGGRHDLAPLLSFVRQIVAEFLGRPALNIDR